MCIMQFFRMQYLTHQHQQQFQEFHWTLRVLRSGPPGAQVASRSGNAVIQCAISRQTATNDNLHSRLSGRPPLTREPRKLTVAHSGCSPEHCSGGSGAGDREPVCRGNRNRVNSQRRWGANRLPPSPARRRKGRSRV